MLEVNNNIIYCSKLKFQKYMRRRNVWSNSTSQGKPTHKAYNKIKLFHCSCVGGHFWAALAVSPLILIQPSRLKCPHIDQRQKTYYTRIMLRTAGVITVLWGSSLFIGPCLDSYKHPWQCTSWKRGFCSERRLLRENVLRCVPERRTLSRLHYQHHHKAFLHCKICRRMHAFFAVRSVRLHCPR